METKEPKNIPEELSDEVLNGAAGGVLQADGTMSKLCPKCGRYTYYDYNTSMHRCVYADCGYTWDDTCDE